MAGTDPPEDGHAGGTDPSRPRWRLGSRAAVVGLGAALVVQGVVDLVLGSPDGGGEAVPPEAALSITAGIGGWPLAAAAVGFVVFSRPWRLLRRRG